MDCSPFSLFQIKHELDRLELDLKMCVDEEERKVIKDEIKMIKLKAANICSEESVKECASLASSKNTNSRRLSVKNTVNIHHNHIFTQEQLAISFNGENGNPLYIAVDGLVFDVSENWCDCEFGKVLDTSAHEELDFLLKHAILVGHVKDY
ncbi:MAG: hypothetical protein ACRCST_08630 [Turicibacter sp.]